MFLLVKELTFQFLGINRRVKILIDGDELIEWLQRKIEDCDKKEIEGKYIYQWVLINLNRFELVDAEFPEVKEPNPVKSYVVDGETWLKIPYSENYGEGQFLHINKKSIDSIRQRDTDVYVINWNGEGITTNCTPEQILGIEEKGDE